MDKELVIVVADETAAYKVVSALKALDGEGSIELYASTVIYRAENGTLAVKDERHPRAPKAAALAMSTGALIGLLAGPVAVAAGAAAGVAAGAAAAGAAVGGATAGVAALGAEATYSGFAGEFVQAVAASLLPGSYAVLASVSEDWTGPVDAAVAPYGAVVFRQATDQVVLAQLKTGWNSLNDELDHVESEIDKAVGEEKAKLIAKRDELRLKQEALRGMTEARLRLIQESWDSKVASMTAKAASAEAYVAARHAEHAQKLSHFAAAQKKAFHDLFA